MQLPVFSIVSLTCFNHGVPVPGRKDKYDGHILSDLIESHERDSGQCVDEQIVGIVAAITYVDASDAPKGGSINRAAICSKCSFDAIFPECSL